MAKILLLFMDADLIECPAYIANHLAKYQRMFDKWLYDPKNNHGYWVDDGFEKNSAVCFDGEAFLRWLNDVVLIHQDEKAFFIKRGFQPSEEEKKLPHINF